MAEFKTGNVVRLASGGPSMTVQGTIGGLNEKDNKSAYTALKMAGYTDDQVICRFWDEASKKFHIEYFIPDMLVLT